MHTWCAVRGTRGHDFIGVHMGNGAHQAARCIDANWCCSSCRRDCAAFNQRRGECNGAVTTHGGVALVVHEEHTDLCLVVIGWHQNAAIHVGMAARLPHQHLAHMVMLLQRRAASLQNGVARELGVAAHHNAEWLPRRVIVEHLNCSAACCWWCVKFQAWHWSTHRASSVPTFFFSARSSSSSAYAKSHAEMPR